MDAITFDNTYPSQNFKKMSFVSLEELADGCHCVAWVAHIQRYNRKNKVMKVMVIVK